MAWQIIWTPEADITFDEVIDQILEKWTEKEVVKFVNRVYEVIGYIENQPKQYMYSRKLDVHRAVINKQISLYYRISEDAIYLLTFWNNRRNPKDLKL